MVKTDELWICSNEDRREFGDNDRNVQDNLISVTQNPIEKYL